MGAMNLSRSSTMTVAIWKKVRNFVARDRTAGRKIPFVTRQL